VAFVLRQLLRRALDVAHVPHARGVVARAREELAAADDAVVQEAQHVPATALADAVRREVDVVVLDAQVEQVRLQQPQQRRQPLEELPRVEGVAATGGGRKWRRGKRGD